MGNLAGGMDTGVGSARADDDYQVSTGKFFQRQLELTLNRALVRLELPTVKAASKVRDGELYP